MGSLHLLLIIFVHAQTTQAIHTSTHTSDVQTPYRAAAPSNQGPTLSTNGSVHFQKSNFTLQSAKNRDISHEDTKMGRSTKKQRDDSFSFAKLPFFPTSQLLFETAPNNKMAPCSQRGDQRQCRSQMPCLQVPWFLRQFLLPNFLPAPQPPHPHACLRQGVNFAADSRATEKPNQNSSWAGHL